MISKNARKSVWSLVVTHLISMKPIQNVIFIPVLLQSWLFLNLILETKMCQLIFSWVIFIITYLWWEYRSLNLTFVLNYRKQSFNFVNHLVCSPTSKCKEGKGHCSVDNDCKDGLRCGRKNCIQDNSKNCCYKPDGNYLFYNHKNEQK